MNLWERLLESQDELVSTGMLGGDLILVSRRGNLFYVGPDDHGVVELTTFMDTSP